MKNILKDFIFKVVLPVFTAWLLFSTFTLIFTTNNGVTDYRLVWIICGIPFGIRHMYVWIIPRRFDIGGTVGTLALCFIIGGLIGGVVIIWKLIKAVYYFIRCIIETILIITGRIEAGA